MQFQMESLTDSQNPSSSMSQPLSAKVVPETNLKIFGSRVRDMCTNLDPNLITMHSVLSIKEEQKGISAARDEYRYGVRKFLIDFASELTDPEKSVWKADLKIVVDQVNRHKFCVLGMVNRLTLPVVPQSVRMTEFEKATLNIQTKQLALQLQSLVFSGHKVVDLVGHLHTVHAAAIPSVLGIQQVGGHAGPLKSVQAESQSPQVGDQSHLMSEHVILPPPNPGDLQGGDQYQLLPKQVFWPPSVHGLCDQYQHLPWQVTKLTPVPGVQGVDQSQLMSGQFLQPTRVPGDVHNWDHPPPALPGVLQEGDQPQLLPGQVLQLPPVPGGVEGCGQPPPVLSGVLQGGDQTQFVPRQVLKPPIVPEGVQGGDDHHLQVLPWFLKRCDQPELVPEQVLQPIVQGCVQGCTQPPPVLASEELPPLEIIPGYKVDHYRKMLGKFEEKKTLSQNRELINISSALSSGQRNLPRKPDPPPPPDELFVLQLEHELTFVLTPIVFQFFQPGPRECLNIVWSQVHFGRLLEILHHKHSSTSRPSCQLKTHTLSNFNNGWFN